MNITLVEAILPLLPDPEIGKLHLASQATFQIMLEGASLMELAIKRSS